MTAERLTYEEFRSALEKERLPCALVNLDALDRNIAGILSRVEGTGKTVRVASKSVRSTYLLRYIADRAGDAAKGLMCFTVEEARFLAGEGFDDLLVAYPSVRQGDMDILARLTAEGKAVSLVVDSEAHLEAMGETGRRLGVEVAAVVELDMAFRRIGGLIHLGARRSPVRNPERVVELHRHAESIGGVRVIGVMGYEAQIAGLTDANPFTPLFNPVKRIVKAFSLPDVAKRRESLMCLLQREGIRLDLFNGGGTGSLETTAAEEAVTEVTVGSGFLCSHLFDYFRGLDLLPAAFFALQVVRVSDPGFVTCQGGGYVASGEAAPDKLPLPHSPDGLSLIEMEGAGEVQTPLKLPADAPELRLGDPVLFRHAKAGELAERFNEILLLRNGRIVDRAPTYRGMGGCFL